MVYLLLILIDFAAVIFMIVKNDLFTKLLPTALSIINIVLGGLLTVGLGIMLIVVWCVDQLDYSPSNYGPILWIWLAGLVLVILSFVLLIRTNKK